MSKRQPFSWLIKTVLVGSALFSAAMAFASKPASPPPRTIYKGEVESNAYASTVIPSTAEYGGHVYDRDLYQGDVEGPGYTPAFPRSLHDGFYMGLEGGYDSYKMNASINIVDSGVGIFEQNPSLSAVGLSYTLVGGYGRYFDPPLYIGAELFYNLSQANTSQNVGLFTVAGVYHVKTEIQNTYGASLMPGVKLNDSTLLYLKGGYTRLDVRTYESSPVLGVSNAQSSGVNGISFGLGLEADVCRNWSLRGEYTHTNYQTYSTSVGTKVSPSGNQFMAGVMLHFF